MINKLLTIWIKNKARLTISLITTFLILGTLSLDSKYLSVLPIKAIGLQGLTKIALCLLVLSMGLLLIILSYIRSLNRKPDFSAYQHSPKKECWINPNNSNDRICSECKANNILTPLEQPGTYWQCPIHQRVIDSTSPSVTTEPDPWK